MEGPRQFTEILDRTIQLLNVIICQDDRIHSNSKNLKLKKEDLALFLQRSQTSDLWMSLLILCNAQNDDSCHNVMKASITILQEYNNKEQMPLNKSVITSALKDSIENVNRGDSFLLLISKSYIDRPLNIIEYALNIVYCIDAIVNQVNSIESIIKSTQEIYKELVALLKPASLELQRWEDFHKINELINEANMMFGKHDEHSLSFRNKMERILASPVNFEDLEIKRMEDVMAWDQAKVHPKKLIPHYGMVWGAVHNLEDIKQIKINSSQMNSTMLPRMHPSELPNTGVSEIHA